MFMKLSNGYTLWKGVSRIDFATRIVAVITSIVNPSINQKTGAMAQIYYMPEFQHPLDAIKNGADRGV